MKSVCADAILTPNFKDAVPGDLSLVFPHRIMVDIEEMIYALDKITPGLASDETLLYGVEVKFYSNKVVVNDKFETNVNGLYAMGDGAGITRGLQQASANGLCVANLHNRQYVIPGKLMKNKTSVAVVIMLAVRLLRCAQAVPENQIKRSYCLQALPQMKYSS